MNRIFLTITLFSILAILPYAIFAQSSNDLDGDGIPNNEDVCPNDKGTKANKGCPGKNENIAPQQTTSNVQTQIDNSRLTESEKKALSGCQYIIEDEGCRKFFGKSEAELSSIFGKLPINGSYGELGVDFYMWSPSTAEATSVAEITFYGTDFGDVKRFYGNPGKNINWNATRTDIIKNYGEPIREANWVLSDGEAGFALYYNEENLRIEFKNGKLYKVTVRYPKHNNDVEAYLEKEKQKYLEEQKSTESRIAQEKANEKAKSEAIQMEADYNELLRQLDAKIEEGNRIVRIETTAIAAGGMFKDAVQKKLDKVKAAGESLIDSFGKKYQGKIPDWMIKGIKAKWSGQ